jgi:hypothetical protein
MTKLTTLVPKNKIEVDYKLVEAAWRNWAETYGPNDYMALIHKAFRSTLNLSVVLKGPVMVSEETATMLRNLAGPHGITYAKAIKAREKSDV